MIVVLQMKVEAGGIARHSCATAMKLLIIPLAFCNHCKAAHTLNTVNTAEHAEQAAQCNVHAHFLAYSTVYASVAQCEH